MAESPDYIDVQMPNGEVIQFPSTMSEAQINQAAQAYFAQTHLQSATPTPTKGFTGIGQDLWQGAKAAGPELIDTIKGLRHLPGEAIGVGKQAVTDPLRLLKNITAGMGKTGEAVGRLPHTIENYLRDKEILEPNQQSIRTPQKINWEELLNLGEPQTGDVLGQGLIGYSPFGAAATIKKAGKLGTLGKQSLAAGAYEAAHERNPVTGALLQTLLDTPFTALGKVATPFEGRLNPAELAEKRRIAQGKDVPLGDIIESPFLKSLQENVLDKTLLSGTEARQTRLANQVQQEAQRLLDGKLAANPTMSANESFKRTLESLYQAQTNIKRKLYEPVDQIARAENFTPELNNAAAYAKSVQKSLLSSPLMQSDPSMRQVVARLTGIAEPSKTTTTASAILGPDGKPAAMHTTTQTPSIADVKYIASVLDKEGTRLLKNADSPSRKYGQIYQKLANQLRADLKDTINTKGSPQLRGALEAADANFAENFAPFLDNEIHKYLDPDVAPDTIARDIIQPGQEDKFSRIEKIQRLMPDNQKNALGIAYLRGALDQEGQIDLNKLVQRLDRLKPKQFEALFPDPKIRQQLQDFTALKRMSNEALNAMFNPKTGQRALGIIPIAQTFVSGMQAGEPLSALATIAAPAALSHMLNSPLIKESYLEALMRNKLGQPGYTQTAADLTKFLAMSLREDEAND